MLPRPVAIPKDTPDRVTVSSTFSNRGANTYVPIPPEGETYEEHIKHLNIANRIQNG